MPAETLTGLLVERQGGVVRVTLNRPEIRNALNETALGEITRTFKGLAKDKTVRAAVLAGAGQDFCAGADIAWMRRAAQLPPAKARKDAARLIEMCRAVDEAPFPVIALVQGNCFGGAIGIIAACDIVIAALDARFRFAETRLGIIPAVVSSFVLPKIGPTHARRLYLTAEIFDASTALAVGLAHRLVARENLETEGRRFQEAIRGNGPMAVRGAKAYVKTLLAMAPAKRYAYSAATLARIRAGAEAKEGFSAFLEKRQPRWTTDSETSA